MKIEWRPWGGAMPDRSALSVGRALGWTCFVAMIPLAACGSDSAEPQTTNALSDESGASEVVIDFQDGFQNHTVVVSLNGEEVFSRRDLTTQALIGLAESVTVVIDADTADVVATVQPGDVDYRARFDLSQGRFIGLSLIGGEIESIQATTAFGYG